MRQEPAIDRCTFSPGFAPFLSDAFDVEIEDRRERYGEERYVLLGMVRHCLLAVTYTPRGERIRIISAGKAEPFERRLYHEKNRKA